MCSILVSIILFCFALAAIIMVVLGFVAFLDFVFFILLLMSIARYNNIAKMTPSNLICPYCGSQKVRMNRVKTSYSMTAWHSYRYGTSSGTSTINTKRIAECKDCGYDFDFYTKDDIAILKKSAKNSIILWSFFV